MIPPLLFLDYDGVLHPDAVYHTSRGVELRAAGLLFMWAQLLVEALVPHQDVQIVLSTSWARNLGYHRARSVLPAELQPRVIGATWHSAMGKGWPDFIPWDAQTRYEQIQAYRSRLSAPASWIAIDDDDRGWADADRDRLILTDPDRGLSTPVTLAELTRKLEHL
ncbi:HAD domain-containing protein [Aquipseudomonas alcaligenes]|uniref:HAD domain-containing protein n=1 Tax=Aquipseudomonas alcaligenes TaxID=43263 RepID=UPI001EEECA73|nr:HAD domain-containing protein [Pseudomonas alcaligenes]